MFYFLDRFTFCLITEPNRIANTPDIIKGHVKIIFVVVQENSNDRPQRQCADEIKQYFDCRYVSPSEAA